MRLNERHPFLKGTTMFFDLLIAIALFVAVGAAVNYIAERFTA